MFFVSLLEDRKLILSKYDGLFKKILNNQQACKDVKSSSCLTNLKVTNITSNIVKYCLDDHNCDRSVKHEDECKPPTKSQQDVILFISEVDYPNKKITYEVCNKVIRLSHSCQELTFFQLEKKLNFNKDFSSYIKILLAKEDRSDISVLDIKTEMRSLIIDNKIRNQEVVSILMRNKLVTHTDYVLNRPFKGEYRYYSYSTSFLLFCLGITDIEQLKKSEALFTILDGLYISDYLKKNSIF